MRHLIKVELPPEPTINHRCIRKHLKQSLCDNCAKVCPINAIKFTYLDAIIDNESCFQCGNCLFTCPVDAIENIKPHTRTHQDNFLIVSHDEPLASKEELLVWHRQFQIRGMKIAKPFVEKWLSVLANLNLQLKILEEPIWQLIITEPVNIDSGRRFILFGQKLDKKPLNSDYVKTGLNARKQFYPQDSWFDIQLETQSCILCSACATVCNEGAIKLIDNTFTLDTTRCTGCMNCQVICLPKSIKVSEKVVKYSKPIQYSFFHAQCKKCNLSFYAWNAESELCPICTQHQKRGWL